MKPRARTDASQLDLFKAQFSQILNPDHPLLILAEKIDWKRFDVALADCFCPDFRATGPADPADGRVAVPQAHVQCVG